MLKGVQQVMLGQVCKNEESAKAALHRVKAAGFEGVELNRFMLHELPWAIRLMTRLAGMPMGGGGKFDLPALVKAEGLTVISLHTDLGTLESKTQEVLEEARALGTDRIVMTGMYHYDYSDEASVSDLIRRVNEMGRQLAKQGYRFHYHNHNCEFLRDASGRLAYERIIEETAPEAVFFEFDSYWAAECGADALYWMERLGERMKLYHINDRGSRGKGKTGSILKSNALELGTGAMNLPALLEKAQNLGCEAVILETHQNWVDKDPLKSIEISGEYLCRQLT